MVEGSFLPIRVRVLYFGQARDVAGTRAEDVSIPGASSVGDLLKSATTAHQRLRRLLGVLRVAVNEELVGSDHLLSDGDVVAFLPPVAGG